MIYMGIVSIYSKLLLKKSGKWNMDPLVKSIRDVRYGFSVPTDSLATTCSANSPWSKAWVFLKETGSDWKTM